MPVCLTVRLRYISSFLAASSCCLADCAVAAVVLVTPPILPAVAPMPPILDEPGVDLPPLASSAPPVFIGEAFGMTLLSDAKDERDEFMGFSSAAFFESSTALLRISSPVGPF